MTGVDYLEVARRLTAAHQELVRADEPASVAAVLLRADRCPSCAGPLLSGDRIAFCAACGSEVDR